LSIKDNNYKDTGYGRIDHVKFKKKKKLGLQLWETATYISTGLGGGQKGNIPKYNPDFVGLLVNF